MSEVMTQGIIGMPYDLAMGDELSRRQFYSRAQSLLADYAALEAELAKLRAGQDPVAFYWQDVGYKNPNRHGPYFGWPTEAALRNVDGGAIPVPLYTTPQPSAVPDADIACDRSYRNGLIAGFGFGINGDEAGYQRSLSCYQQGIHEALAAAPSAPATLPSVNQQLLEALEAAEKKLCIAEYHLDKGEDDSVVFESEILLARAAIAAARKGEGKV